MSKKKTKSHKVRLGAEKAELLKTRFSEKVKPVEGYVRSREKYIFNRDYAFELLDSETFYSECEDW